MGGNTSHIQRWLIKLFQTKLEDGEPLQLHLDKILNAAQKLTNVNFAVPEPLLVLVILASLPFSWETLVTTLHTTITTMAPSDCNQNPNCKFISDWLYEYEKMQTLAGNSRGSALTAQGKQKGENKAKKDKKLKMKCKNNKKTNHKMKDCFAKGGLKY